MNKTKIIKRQVLDKMREKGVEETVLPHGIEAIIEVFAEHLQRVENKIPREEI